MSCEYVRWIWDSFQNLAICCKFAKFRQILESFCFTYVNLLRVDFWICVYHGWVASVIGGVSSGPNAATLPRPHLSIHPRLMPKPHIPFSKCEPVNILNTVIDKSYRPKLYQIRHKLHRYFWLKCKNHLLWSLLN